jgi:hypothetical protein
MKRSYAAGSTVKLTDAIYASIWRLNGSHVVLDQTIVSAGGCTANGADEGACRQELRHV